MGKANSKSSPDVAFDRIKSVKKSISNREKIVPSKLGKIHSNSKENECRRFVEHTILVWLDGSLNQKTDTNQSIVNQFRRLTNNVETFSDLNLCVQFLTSIEKENIFIVVSGSLGQQLLLQIKDHSPIQSIYIYCGNKTHHEQWVKAYPQIRGVYTNIKLLCDILGGDIRRLDYSLTCITFIPASSKFEFNASTADFFTLQLIKNIVLEHSSSVSSQNHLLNYARPFYEHHSSQLALIDRWKENYSQHAPLWWYTRKCFIYSMLRKALQYEDYELIYHLAFFIRELHRDIKKSYLQMSSNQRRPISVYRATQMTPQQWEWIEKNPRALLAFNDFLLTTIEKHIAMNFVNRLRIESKHLINIIYRIDIDPRKTSMPYIPLDHLSYSSDDNGEVLLSMNTIFRIDEITCLQENLYEIILIPANRKDEEIIQVIEILEELVMDLPGWYQISRALMEKKAYQPLQRIYQSLFNQSEPNQRQERAFLQHELGYLAELQNQWNQSIEHYKQSIIISLTYVSTKDPNLRPTYTNLAFVMEQNGDFDGAIEQCHNALNTLSANDPTIIHIYNQMANILQKQEKHLEAHQIYEKARTTLQQNFPSAETLLADLYHSMGGMYYRKKDYTNALAFYEKVLSIDERTIGMKHPSPAVTYLNLATVYDACRKRTQAIEYAEKALEIARNVYGNEHIETREIFEYCQKLQQSVLN